MPISYNEPLYIVVDPLAFMPPDKQFIWAWHMFHNRLHQVSNYQSSSSDLISLHSGCCGFDRFATVNICRTGTVLLARMHYSLNKPVECFNILRIKTNKQNKEKNQNKQTILLISTIHNATQLCMACKDLFVAVQYSYLLTLLQYITMT